MLPRVSAGRMLRSECSRHLAVGNGRHNDCEEVEENDIERREQMLDVQFPVWQKRTPSRLLVGLGI